MSKTVVRVLIGFGLFLFFLGIIFRSGGLSIIGLLMIAAGAYLGVRPGGILRKEQVSETWAILIEKGQGRAGEIFQDAEGFIKESKAPSIKMERKEISPGIVRGLLGTKRDFLVVTDQENFRLQPYQIFVNARDYGDNLDVSWFLTYRPTLWQAVLSLVPFVSVIPRTLSDLDLFDQMDLRVYTTNAHHCVQKAVTKLLAALHQDSSKIDWKSRGFLGIS